MQTKLIHPLDDLLPQELVGNLLKTFNLRVYRDLMDFNLEQLNGLRGIGLKKREMLYMLKEEALSRVGYDLVEVVVQDEEEVYLEEWREDGLDPKVVLGPLSSRIIAILEDYDLRTIKDLRSWLQSIKVAEIRNYGSSTDKAIRERLSLLNTHGVNFLVFAGDRPDNVMGLAERFLSILDEDKRRIFNGFYVEGMTLASIGEVNGLSRERVRQIYEKTLESYRSSWSPWLKELLAPLYLLLEAQGGFASTLNLFDLLNNPPRWCLELCLDILGEDGFLLLDIWPNISTNLTSSQAYEVREVVRDELDFALKENSSVDNALELFAKLGIHCSSADLSCFLEQLGGVVLYEGRLYPRRRRLRAAYVHVLREMGGPATLQDVIEQVNIKFPDLTASPSKVLAGFKMFDEVYSYDRMRWIHIENLPFDAKSLDVLIQQCLPFVKEARGQGVSVPKLIGRLKANGYTLEGLTPRLLQDALVRTGQVRAWRAGSQVAWRNAELRRKTLIEQIVSCAEEAEQPFYIDELIDRLVKDFGFESSSIFARIHTVQDILLVKKNQAYAKNTLFKEDEFEDLQQVILGHVPYDDLLTIPQLMERCPESKSWIEKYGYIFLWSVMRSHPALEARYRGTFLWRQSFATNFWDAFLRSPQSIPVLFKPSHFQEIIINRYGVVADALEYYLIREAHQAGMLLRVAPGLYLRNDLSSSVQYEALSSSPEIMHLALNSPNLVRESPVRDVLNALRTSQQLPPI